MRLTASRPGQISFEARLQTPQRATVEATPDGDLVMRGVNGDGRGTTADGRPMTGALRFEARVRVLPTRRHAHRVGGDAVVVRGADAVTLLIAAATSYRRYDDVGGDPAARGRGRARSRGAARPSTRCAPRTSATTGSCSTASRSTSARRRGGRCRSTSASRRSPTGGDPGARRALLPVRALPAHRQLAARARSRPTCRASGTTACRRRGAASTRSTSTPR